MIKKEINYLSLPDYFNKYLYINYNQKIDKKGSFCLKIEINTTRNLGYALKAIVQLELMHPKKVSCLVIRISKKQTYNKKSKNVTIFRFFSTMNSYEFVDMYRYFLTSPYSSTKIQKLPVVAKKLKNFDLKFDTKLSVTTTKSFEYLKMYHLN